MTEQQLTDEDIIKASESYVDLTKLEKREHQWVQRGRFFSCHCHPHTGVQLPDDINLVGVHEGQPIFAKG